MKNLIFFSIILFLTTQVSAQQSTFNTTFTSDVAFNNQDNIDKKTANNVEAKTEWADFARMAKPLNASYTGFKVELLGVQAPLNANHAIYNQFGKINIAASTDTPFNYYYLIGDFKKLADAEKFLNNVIINRYPNATVAEYKNGVRQ